MVAVGAERDEAGWGEEGGAGEEIEPEAGFGAFFEGYLALVEKVLLGGGIGGLGKVGADGGAAAEDLVGKGIFVAFGAERTGERNNPNREVHAFFSQGTF